MQGFVIGISFVTTLLSIFLLRPLAIKFKLVDYPTDRKNHYGQIPFIGGMCVFIGFFMSQVYLNEFDKISTGIIITAFLMLIIGIWDDFVNLRAKIKLVLQVTTVGFMIYIADLKLESFGFLFGVSSPIELGLLSIPFTIIAVVGLTNAFNMIDGIDGLAGSLVLVAIIGMFFSNMYNEGATITNILLSIGSALFPFLMFNIASNQKLKIFLGDGGSLFLGYLVSLSLIYSAENISNFTPSFALWCVLVPLFDFFSVVIIRIIEKRSLIQADRDHIHHLLEILGFSKKLTMILIIFSALLMLLFGFIIEKNYPVLSFPIFMIFFLIYLIIRVFLRSKDFGQERSNVQK